MFYVYLIIIGFFVGLVARILLPGRDPMGIFKTTVVGILGSYLGAFVGNYFNIAINESWQHFAIAVAASFLLLVLYRFIRNV